MFTDNNSSIFYENLIQTFQFTTKEEKKLTCGNEKQHMHQKIRKSLLKKCTNLVSTHQNIIIFFTSILSMENTRDSVIDYKHFKLIHLFFIIISFTNEIVYLTLTQYNPVIYQHTRCGTMQKTNYVHQHQNLPLEYM